MAAPAKKNAPEPATEIPGETPAAAPSPPATISPPWMIKAGDITETKYWISCSNTTTHTEVPRDRVVEVVEFGENGILLRLPARTCSLGHLLTLNLERRRSVPFAEKSGAGGKGKKPADSAGSGDAPAAAGAKGVASRKKTTVWAVEDKIQLTAKVVEIEELSDTQTVAATLQFYQCDQSHWRRFLEDLVKRQKAATDIVRRMSE